MKTLLIPVDFSGISENVLKYIVGFATDTKVEHVILLKSFYVSVYAELLPSADFVQLSAGDIRDERQGAELALTALANKLSKKLSPLVKITTAISGLPILRAVYQVVDQESPNIVLLGSDKTVLENDSYMAEQIIAIAKTSAVPVMIVPECARYEKIELALVPCDFAVISQLEALYGIHDRKKWLHPRLMVLNTNPKLKNSESDSHIAAGLAELLAGYDYKVYHTEDKDTVKGILHFADKHNTQMIIALPGKYSFFYNLTHRNITNALALNATRPVLILK
ncbi:MAG: universal stress protein [Mucilaginibacter sp.]|nr:universal stress protein [Mucilaginibacter sp.]